jgi:VIT1/CCC1 family predicted Fe2+/Mn2+ transporter
MLAPADLIIWSVAIGCLLGLASLGATGARAGGADVLKPTLRVVFWGAIAMLFTAAIGSVVGHAV